MAQNKKERSHSAKNNLWQKPNWLKIENNQATIHLDSPVKSFFWEQNLADIIPTVWNLQWSNYCLIRLETEDRVKEEPVYLTSQPDLTEKKNLLH